MKLPIEAVKAELLEKFRAGQNLVLIAEPGAGKTTQVPLWLLKEPSMRIQKITLLEPRRIAARAAAQRMAVLLGEELGQTVGLRMKAETKVSANTRLEVVTEGVFARMIMDQPELPGIGAVLFDEFHERSLDADFGLALALDVQSALRSDLKLMALSATIDAQAVSKLMGGADIVRSEGRSFPVETIYLGSNKRAPIAPQVADAIMHAFKEQTGSMLVFLPGRGEIEAVRRILNDRFSREPNVLVAPLYAGLPQDQQSAALEPASTGKRKIVLSTTLAQTSMTIEGVRVVIDAGLTRRPRYDPQTGISRLETVRVSLAAADQRRGRAGRTEAGVCYRLWAEPETRSLAAQDRPEMLETDLSRFALDLAEWGVDEPQNLAFLDYPGGGHFSAAQARLRALEMLDSSGRITALGKSAQGLPLEPHIGAMILKAVDEDTTKLRSALLLSVLLTEPMPRGELDLRIHFSRAVSHPQSTIKRAFERLCRLFKISPKGPHCPRDELANLLLCAFPQWVAVSRGPGRFQVLAGQRIQCPTDHPFAGEKHLVITDMTGNAANLKLIAACPLPLADFEIFAEKHTSIEDELSFDPHIGRVKAERIISLGTLVLDRKPLKKIDQAQAETVFWQAMTGQPAATLLTAPKVAAVIKRMQFLHATIGAPWPDTSLEHLQKTVEDWLRPFLPGVSSLGKISAGTIIEALKARAPNFHELGKLAPERFTFVDGRSLEIDYSNENGPTLHARVQEFYGVTQHPSIANATPLILDLLSPARRSIQITTNLPAFWEGSWSDVRSDMRGRYPKHNWPENPSQALHSPELRKK